MDSGQWGSGVAGTFSEKEDPTRCGDTPCFLYVWQGKDLRERAFACVAAKGLTGGRKQDFDAFLGCVAGKGVKRRRGGDWRVTRKAERVGSGQLAVDSVGRATKLKGRSRLGGEYHEVR